MYILREILVMSQIPMWELEYDTIIVLLLRQSCTEMTFDHQLYSCEFDFYSVLLIILISLLGRKQGTVLSPVTQH